MSAVAGLAPERSTDSAAQRAICAEPAALTTRVVDGADWDRIVSGFDAVCQEQLHAFAARRWPDVVQEPVLFERDGRVVGGALMMIQSLPLNLAKIAVSKWAPMLANASVADARAIHAGMIEALVAEYADKRGMLLSVLPRASTDKVNQDYVCLRRRGFRRGSSLLYPNRYLVNLRLTDEALRKSFHQKWRYHLGKAEKSGLAFQRVSADRIGDFKSLYAAMIDRKQFPDHSAYETLDGLMAMEEPLRPELFFVSQGDELVAGALIFKAGDRAVYLYGATNDRALSLRAGYYLHWHVIRWLRDNTRAGWYDLGGTDGFQGLHQFKKGMVGEAGLIRPVPPVANYASNPVAYWLGTGAFMARDGVNALKRQWAAMRNPKARPDQARHVPEDYLS